VKLIEYNCAEFSELLAAHSPTPGGGSAAALIGSYGAALCAMVAHFTIGREKYAEQEVFMKEALSQAGELRIAFMEAVDADTEAYNAVSGVLSMPKSTPDEKAARKQAMEEALKEAALVPFTVMELSQKAIALIKNMTGIANPHVTSDLGVAAVSLRAALCGAWLNVCTNLNGIKDETFTNEYRTRGEAIITQSLPLADEIYAKILPVNAGKKP